MQKENAGDPVVMIAHAFSLVGEKRLLARKNNKGINAFETIAELIAEIEGGLKAIEAVADNPNLLRRLWDEQARTPYHIKKPVSTSIEDFRLTLLDIFEKAREIQDRA